jgi:predicted amidophosphoribosyltransferase
LSRLEARKSHALKDAKYSSRFCPQCGFPVPDWLKACRVCGLAVGRHTQGSSDQP